MINNQNDEIDVSKTKLSLIYQIKIEHVTLRELSLSKMEMKFFIPGVGFVVERLEGSTGST